MIEKSKKKLLVVDDLAMNRMVLKKILANDYDIDEAEDGEEALEMLRQHGGEYHMIILDNHMPKMSGLELLKIISNNPWLRKMPVIMTSSDETEEFVNHAYELGVIDFFFVPYSPSIIKRRIQYVLKLFERHYTEVTDALEALTELYYVIMQINLKDDSCMIIDTSESKDMWDKDISSKAKDAVKLFTEYGYIHDNDIEPLISFLDSENIKKQIDAGAQKLFLKYRRRYKGEYRWAFLEIHKIKNYSEENPIVIVSSRDMQDTLAERRRELLYLSEKAISTDSCNLTRNTLYHEHNDSEYEEKLKNIDKVTDIIDWVADHIPDQKNKKEFTDTFQPDNLIQLHNQGKSRISVEHVCENDQGKLKLFDTTVQTYKNSYTKDIEAIYFTKEISDFYVQKKIQESLYESEYAFIGLLNTKSDTMYVHKTTMHTYRNIKHRSILYAESVKHDIMHHIPQKNHKLYLKNVSIDNIVEQLSLKNSYEFTIDCIDPNGMPVSMQHVYRYFDKEYGIILCMYKNISELAEQDTVTSGLNQKGFERRVRKILNLLNDDRKYSILHFDIKEFKAINEMFGFEVGNIILNKVYEQINNSELYPILTARTMADQFVCLIDRKNLDSDQIINLCQIHLIQNEKPLLIRMVCGICHVEDKGDSVHSMCDKAKMAEKYIKNEFIMPFEIFKASMNDIYIKRMHIMNTVFSALENKEFHTYYQPIFDTFTEKIVSAEALVRWINPVEGIVSPGLFIPALEEKGTISKLDLYISQSVTNFLNRRAAENKFIVPISTNLSRMDFFDEEMLNKLYEQVNAVPLSKEFFRFEVTESAYVDISNRNEWIIENLRKIGCKILIDDFGTGYSSLGNLCQQKYDIIKMDMSFVKSIGKSENTDAIIKALIEMIHGMGCKVIAEGVETEEQLLFLRERKCDYIQGYYFSKPLSEEEFYELLDQHQ